ncbi:hypothetical protein ABTN04_19060, partial [Acinetobacter baumannii]
MAALREQLSLLVTLLHKTHQNGLAVYGAIGICIENKHNDPAVFSWPDPNTHSFLELEKLHSLSSEMAALAGQLRS